jgi:hypothetical protein
LDLYKTLNTKYDPFSPFRTPHTSKYCPVKDPQSLTQNINQNLFIEIKDKIVLNAIKDRLFDKYKNNDYANTKIENEINNYFKFNIAHINLDLNDTTNKELFSDYYSKLARQTLVKLGEDDKIDKILTPFTDITSCSLGTACLSQSPTGAINVGDICFDKNSQSSSSSPPSPLPVSLLSTEKLICCNPSSDSIGMPKWMLPENVGKDKCQPAKTPTSGYPIAMSNSTERFLDRFESNIKDIIMIRINLVQESFDRKNSSWKNTQWKQECYPVISKVKNPTSQKNYIIGKTYRNKYCASNCLLENNSPFSSSSCKLSDTNGFGSTGIQNGQCGISRKSINLKDINVTEYEKNGGSCVSNYLDNYIPCEIPCGYNKTKTLPDKSNYTTSPSSIITTQDIKWPSPGVKITPHQNIPAVASSKDPSNPTSGWTPISCNPLSWKTNSPGYVYAFNDSSNLVWYTDPKYRLNCEAKQCSSPATLAYKKMTNFSGSPSVSSPCNAGYSGNVSIICDDSTGLGVITDNCKANTCSIKKDISGYTNPSGIYNGSNGTFNCNFGFKNNLGGPPSSFNFKCELDGKTVVVSPTGNKCVGQNCPISSPAGKSSKDANFSPSPGTIQCNDGYYEKSKDMNYQCSEDLVKNNNNEQSKLISNKCDLTICTSPATTKHDKKSVTITSPQSDYSISCNPGYTGMGTKKPTTSMSFNCDWTQQKENITAKSTSFCNPNQCTPTNITNATITSSAVYGSPSPGTFKCNTGYDYNGSSTGTFRCDNNNTLIGGSSIKCTGKTCTLKETNGSSTTSATFGSPSSGTFQCSSGYNYSGKGTFNYSCNSDGSGQADNSKKCNVNICPPVSFTNSNRSSKTTLKNGEQDTVICDAGYAVGSSASKKSDFTISCTPNPNGFTSSIKGSQQCVGKQATLPASVNNGSWRWVNGTEETYPGAKVYLECDDGFYNKNSGPNGTKVSLKNDGSMKWDIPTTLSNGCSPQTCKALKEPNYHNKGGATATAGNGTEPLNCLPGYSSGTISCSANNDKTSSTGNTSVFACQGNTMTPPTINNGTWNFKPNTVTTFPNAEIVLTCNEGYHPTLNGDPINGTNKTVVGCDKSGKTGGWESTVGYQCNKQTCKVETGHNNQAESTLVNAGSTHNLLCTPGYENGSLTCDGTSSQKPYGQSSYVSCKGDTISLPTDEGTNGKWSWVGNDQTYPNAKAVFNCNTGYWSSKSGSTVGLTTNSSGGIEWDDNTNKYTCAAQLCTVSAGNTYHNKETTITTQTTNPKLNCQPGYSGGSITCTPNTNQTQSSGVTNVKACSGDTISLPNNATNGKWLWKDKSVQTYPKAEAVFNCNPGYWNANSGKTVSLTIDQGKPIWSIPFSPKCSKQICNIKQDQSPTKPIFINTGDTQTVTCTSFKYNTTSSQISCTAGSDSKNQDGSPDNITNPCIPIKCSPQHQISNAGKYNIQSTLYNPPSDIGYSTIIPSKDIVCKQNYFQNPQKPPIVQCRKNTSGTGSLIASGGACVEGCTVNPDTTILYNDKKQIVSSLANGSSGFIQCKSKYVTPNLNDNVLKPYINGPSVMQPIKCINGKGTTVIIKGPTQNTNTEKISSLCSINRTECSSTLSACSTQCGKGARTRYEWVSDVHTGASSIPATCQMNIINTNNISYWFATIYTDLSTNDIILEFLPNERVLSELSKEYQELYKTIHTKQILNIPSNQKNNFNQDIKATGRLYITTEDGKVNRNMNDKNVNDSLYARIDISDINNPNIYFKNYYTK